MIVSEVVTRVLRQFGDEASVQISQDDIIRWINDGQKEIAVQNELLQATGLLSSVAGQQEYSFPADMLALRSLYYESSRLKSLKRTEYDEYININDPLEITTGIPILYTHWTNKFLIYPKPDVAVTDGIKLFYIQRPVDVTLPANSLSLPLEYHNRIVEYCLQQAYETDEDWEAASAKASQLSQGLDSLKERETSKDREYYPVITILPEDE